MTAKIDGTNGLLQQYDYQVLTTAFSYTFAAGTTVLVINPAGTLATGTITMPAAPADGMTITVESTQQVTALTMSGNGGTVVGPAIQLIPNQPLSWVYRLTNTSWYPLFGGAGRASALVSGTAVASTSGTSIDFTSIPSWVKRVTVMFNGVSTTGANAIIIQLGVSGTPETTGYISICGSIQNTSASVLNSTAGFLTTTSANIGSATTVSGLFTIGLIGSNIWSYSGNISRESAGNTVFFGAGSKTLAGTMNMVRITTIASDTFDAGTINILYE